MGVWVTRTCSDDFSPRSIASRGGGRIWYWRRREAVCSLAIQGRVSQNLRLIQVIFGHTASEGRGASVSVSVCVQTRSRPRTTEIPTAEEEPGFDSAQAGLGVIVFSITAWWSFVV